mmetsp:Transcript_8965/g.28883  ORF Transcript_8965/g.28883 Transcript_8965/m.28883 type:complete len:290 (+) Transcript_8965:249-1118(+)
MEYAPINTVATKIFLALSAPGSLIDTASCGKIPHPCNISLSLTVYFPAGNFKLSFPENVPNFTSGFNFCTSAKSIFLAVITSPIVSPFLGMYVLGALIFAIPLMISKSLALNAPLGIKIVCPIFGVPEPIFLFMFLNVSTFSLRLLAMDSSVSPERKVYGRVPEPPPRFAAFIGIPLDPVLAFAFLFSSETNVTRFCPILFPTTVEEFCILKPFVFKASFVTVKLMPTTFDRNEKNKSALSLSLFLSSLERKTRKGNKVLRKMKFRSPTGVVVVVVFFRLNSKEERKKD